MTVFSDALAVETRDHRHDTATSHVLAGDGTPLAATDPALIASLLRWRLNQIDEEGWT